MVTPRWHAIMLMLLGGCTVMAQNALDDKPLESGPGGSGKAGDVGASTGGSTPICSLPGDCEPDGFVGSACHQWACANEVCVEQMPEGNPCTGQTDVDGFCDGSGACQEQNNGEPCTGPAACDSGHCVDGVCCNLPCSEDCRQCQPSGTCNTLTSGNPDGDCSGNACQSNGACCGDAPGAPARGGCPPACDSCTQGTCVIACDENQECKGDVLTCPSGWDCQLVCSDTQACEQARLDCPAFYHCDVVCTSGDQACKELEINCANGPCSVSCGAADQCIDAVLNCGTQRCTANCNGDVSPTVAGATACDVMKNGCD